MPAKRTNSPSSSKRSDKPYEKSEKAPKDKTTSPKPTPSTPPNWQTRYPEWSNDPPAGENAKRCIEKWCLLPPFDHGITEDQWELYYKERLALDEVNTCGSEASSHIQSDELRPPLMVLADSVADVAAAIYGSVLVEESKIAIARTLRGSLYITEADGQEGWRFHCEYAALFSFRYSFDYRASDFFGLLIAISNQINDADAENPRKCKGLKEDGASQEGSVELFTWASNFCARTGGNSLAVASATEISSFEPTLFGSTGWLSPRKLQSLLLGASTCSQYDDDYQELDPGIAVASSKKLKFFEGETTGAELGDSETVLYRKLRNQAFTENGLKIADEFYENDYPGCLPDRLLLLARHKEA